MSAWRNLQKRNPLKYPKKARAAKFMTIINFEDPWSIASFVPRQNLKYARHRTGKLRIFAHFTYLESYLYLSNRILTRVAFGRDISFQEKTSRRKKIPKNYKFPKNPDLAQNKIFPEFGIPKKSHLEAHS